MERVSRSAKCRVAHHSPKGHSFSGGFSTDRLWSRKFPTPNTPNVGPIKANVTAMANTMMMTAISISIVDKPGRSDRQTSLSGDNAPN